MGIFRALLYFNLPHDLVFREKVRPVKGFSYPPETHPKKAELKDLIYAPLESSHEESKT